jgi:gas vesicle protein
MYFHSSLIYLGFASGLRMLRENRQANVDLIRKQKERIEKEIRDLREAMNNHLDKVQKKLTRELMEVEVNTNNGIQEVLTTLQRKEEEIYQSQVNMRSLIVVAVGHQRKPTS